MRAPLWDFVQQYAEKETVRLHMPGHKGVGNAEKYDITEIAGADSLYEAQGVIRESEENAGRLFGAHTFYSAEGSSLCIRAMLYLVTVLAKSKGQVPSVFAGRNAHKSFVGAAALLDISVTYLFSKDGSYLSCPLTAEEVAAYLDNAKALPTAVYLTSPDYLGNMVDVGAIARVCHERGVLLLVDNAHGAYLKFLSISRHPMDLGADMCCDSAHKTLFALTGAAYLHVSKNAPDLLARRAKTALALFGSTSPSYLILASLDRLNAKLSDGYREELRTLLDRLKEVKDRLACHGYGIVSEEPMKLTLATKAYGYTGWQVAEHLRAQNIEPEYADPDFLVLMPTPETLSALSRLEGALLALPRKEAIMTAPPTLFPCPVVLSPREALCAEEESVPVEKAVGQVLACVTVGCPPAVPIAVSGERITRETVKAFLYYGITHCLVVRK